MSGLQLLGDSREVYTRDEVLSIVGRLLTERSAQIKQADLKDTPEVRTVTVDLSTARSENNPQVVGFPFKSFRVESIDGTNKISVKIDDQSEGIESFLVGKNDGWGRDTMASRAFLHWEAQSGTAVLKFFTSSTFLSGSQVSTVAGGISINNGSSRALATVTLAAGAATEVLADDSDRKKGLFRNTTGGDIYLGPDNTVTAASGFPLGAGETWEDDNTGALYAFNPGAASDIVVYTQS